MRRPRSRLLVAAVAAALVPGACGDGSDDLGAERARQVRDVAVDAGLGDDVADVLALAARGTSATFQVTYAGTEGSSVVVSQDPPNHRFDVLAGEVVVESWVVRDGITYRCAPPPGGRPGDELRCERERAAVDRPGLFSAEALEDFAGALAGSQDRFDLTVEQRTIADTEATCLVTAPVAGTPIDGEGPGVDTLCLSPEGAQLLIDSGGERLVADAYRTDVPDGTFEV